MPDWRMSNIWLSSSTPNVSRRSTRSISRRSGSPLALKMGARASAVARSFAWAFIAVMGAKFRWVGVVNQ